MGEGVVYHSQMRIERSNGPLRYARIPAEQEPVLFGVHSECAVQRTRGGTVMAMTLSLTIAAAIACAEVTHVTPASVAARS